MKKFLFLGKLKIDLQLTYWAPTHRKNFTKVWGGGCRGGGEEGGRGKGREGEGVADCRYLTIFTAEDES
jgi:hypothetical protein